MRRPKKKEKQRKHNMNRELNLPERYRTISLLKSSKCYFQLFRLRQILKMHQDATKLMFSQTPLNSVAATSFTLLKIAAGYGKHPICEHCISALPLSSLALSNTWTHHSAPNPWPTVPLWEETDVGNVSHSFFLTRAHKKTSVLNWHIIQRTETAYRADIQYTRVPVHIASSRAIDRPLLFLSVAAVKSLLLK